MDTQKSEEFYKKLKTQLADTSLWPAKYLYKFIVPSQQEKIDEIESFFDGLGAVITKKESTKGSYTSISIAVRMTSPDHVIEKYKQVASVEGVISL